MNQRKFQVGTLNRYLFIFKRLIFESRVRDGRPSFAAAPAVPEIRPLLSASAASIISFSCFTSTPLSGSGRANLGGACFLEPALVHGERFTLAQDHRSLNYVL